MNTIKLDRQKIRAEIEAGDNCNGGRVLAVAPDGSDADPYWAEQRRAWDPWPDGWLTIQIPALWPDGHGEEYETAEDCLRDNGLDPDDVRAEIDEGTEFDGLVDYCEARFPEYMEAATEERLDWLLAAFLSALNGDGTDLNDPTPWGYILDNDGQPVGNRQPPAHFEWA